MNRDQKLAQLKAMREELATVVKTVSDLSAKHLASQADGSTTPKLEVAEQKAWTDALDKSEALRADIEKIEREIGLLKFADADAPERRGIDYGAQVGTDVVRIAENGEMKFVDRMGAFMGPEAMKAISEPTYGKAFERSLRGNADKADHELLTAALALARKTMREGLEPDGGYLAPPTFVWEIIRQDSAPTSVFDMVRQIPSGSDTLKLPKLDYGTNDDIYRNPMRFLYDGEEDPPTAGDTPTWGMHEIPIHGGKMEFPVTRDLLDDAVVPLEAIIGEEFRDSFRLTMEDKITNNATQKGPQGFLVNAGAAGGIPTVDIGDPATADGLLSLNGALPAQYRPGSVYVMQQEDTYTTLSKLKASGSDEYIFGKLGYQDRGLALELQEMLLGKRIFFDPFMPTPATDANTIAYANFRKLYVFTQRAALTVLRSDLPREAYVWFVMRARNGGKVVQARAGRIGVQA